MRSRRKVQIALVMALAAIAMLNGSTVSAQDENGPPSLSLDAINLPPGSAVPINDWNPIQITAQSGDNGNTGFAFVNNTGIPFPDFSVTWVNPNGPEATGTSGIYQSLTVTHSGSSMQFETDDFTGGTIQNGQQFELTVLDFGPDTVLTVVPTPEPSTFALFGIATGLLVRRSRTA